MPSGFEPSATAAMPTVITSYSIHYTKLYDVHRPDETVNDCGPVLIPPGLTEIARMSDAITRRPVVSGNRVEPLHNGEAAYPAMLAAIGNAEQYIFLTTYIFETNTTSYNFV